ncbi:MAG TPA: hypothetical protein VHB98_17295, partial [Chloroflexota bacterium]|nr:hypothetical protein [Chloroflexota bacterium]
SEEVAIYTEAVPSSIRSSSTHPSHGFIRVADRVFRCQDYQFGYTVCHHCHSDQAFYVHHADLQRGYTFRCRICQHELTVSIEN